MIKEKHKTNIKITQCILYVFLIAIFFTGCLSPYDKQQIAYWWTTKVTDMTGGDIFVGMVLASMLANIINGLSN